ncbi:MAG: class aldolase/adducin family protein [Bradyrhizobium sp.]|nr:class aldolase/adducin family protein [Bradyrhizobium sp.]
MTVSLHQRSDIARFDIPDVHNRVSAEEWAVRVDLAACYRLVAHFGWNSLIYNHISARVPGDEEHYLLNPFGLLYEEITASNLVKVDMEGKIVDPTPHRVHPAGFTLHRAIHQARPDVQCALHIHTAANMAVSTMECGLLPLTQNAMLFYNNVAYHDFEGLALDCDENDRVARDLGDKAILILRNHGVLVAAASVPLAFVMTFSLELAFQAQVQALSSGQKLITPSEKAAMQTSRLGFGNNKENPDFAADDDPEGRIEWPAMLRLLDRIDPSYKQ